MMLIGAALESILLFIQRQKVEQAGTRRHFKLFPRQLIASRIEGGLMKTLRSALVAFAVLFVATAAHAQSTKVAATIPFNFVAGDRAYPAGDYLFSNNGSVLRIASEANTSIDEMTQSQACETLRPSDKTKVVFRQMGGDYFLEQIWVAGENRGHELPRSKSETHLAQNHEKSESVIVAANLVK
jgi:hypothetical protein